MDPQMGFVVFVVQRCPPRALQPSLLPDAGLYPAAGVRERRSWTARPVWSLVAGLFRSHPCAEASGHVPAAAGCLSVGWVFVAATVNLAGVWRRWWYPGVAQSDVTRHPSKLSRQAEDADLAMEA